MSIARAPNTASKSVTKIVFEYLVHPKLDHWMNIRDGAMSAP